MKHPRGPTFIWVACSLPNELREWLDHFILANLSYNSENLNSSEHFGEDSFTITTWILQKMNCPKIFPNCSTPKKFPKIFQKMNSPKLNKPNFPKTWINSSGHFFLFPDPITTHGELFPSCQVVPCVTLPEKMAQLEFFICMNCHHSPPNFDVVLEKTRIKMWRIWKFHLKCLFETKIFGWNKKVNQKTGFWRTTPHLVTWKLMVVRWSFPFGDAIFSSASC